jgi:hypothetical protein
MLRTIEIIKEQIKAIQNDQKEEKKSEIQELQELVEFINYDREILLSENQRLTKLLEENPWQKKYLEAQASLENQKKITKNLYKRLEDLEDTFGFQSFDKSCMETNSYTDRSFNNSTLSNSSPRKSACSAQKTVKHSNSFHKTPEKVSCGLNSSAEAKTGFKHSNSLSKSPEKPPRASEKISKSIKIAAKATIEIKNNLAKAIDQAHKTLFHTQNRKRSASPCINSPSSRYSTPPKNLFLDGPLGLSN